MKNIRILSENFHFLVVKCSIYLNRLVFVMFRSDPFSVVNSVCCVTAVPNEYV